MLSRLRRVLADDLGIDPSPSVTQLEERILLHDPALDVDATTPTNLPAPISSFIGRIEEQGELESAIFEHRLVTVTGPGGAGKTRLAMEAAARVAGSFPDGVWLIDLAQVATPDGVSEAVASTLRLVVSAAHDETDALLARLRPQTTLILLDNCEHVAEAAGSLALRLLGAVPGLCILATSRRPLETAGEYRFQLDGLHTSTGEAPGEAQLLFADRAAYVRPGFALGEPDLPAVSSVCRHLDGMPLAIELAASRADTLSPAEIDGYLMDRFRLLGDPHQERPAHRSLQASLDWSYELLTRDDRANFDALGVFEGPFRSCAATAALETDSEIATVEVLRRLTGGSLVQVLAGEVSRYRLLETMRLYARTHLDEAGRWEAVAARHDRHYRDRCRELRAAVFGSGRMQAIRAIEAEIADYEAAFDRYLEIELVVDALDMGWPLGHVWLFSGGLDKGIRRLQALMDASQGLEIRSRADALTAASFLLMYATRYDQAIHWADEAASIYAKIGDEQGLAYAHARRGHLAFSVGDVPTALAVLQESLEICDRIGYEEGSAWPLTLLAQARLWAGDESDEVRHMLEEGRRRFIAIGDTFGQMHANVFIPNVGEQSTDRKVRYARESVELADRPGADPLTRPTALHNLAFSMWDAGQRERAEGLNRIAARSALETGAKISSGMVLLQAGLFAGVDGDGERAAVLYGAGDRYFVMQKPPFYVRQIQPGIDAAVDALGEERYKQSYEHGHAMSIEDATEFLLGN